MVKISKSKLKKKLEEVNKVCNMDFKMEEYRYGWYRAVSENSDVSSPFLDLEGLWFWLDAFMQGWIIKKIAEEMHQEEMKKGLKKKRLK
jgi:hypothetical protein